MRAYPDGYDYRLVISNRTVFELTPVGRELSWGLWWREGVDGRLPRAVPPGATLEVLGIRASKSNAKGCECRVTWEAAGTDPGFPDAVTLFVSLPIMASGNRAGLDVSGRLKVEGWTGVSRLGHSFSHMLTVSAPGI